MRRRRDELDPLADVPERLRRFNPGWLDVAAQGPDGYDEALAAGDAWLRDRRAWQEVHGYRGSVLEWLRANHAVRYQLWRASEVWRPEAERWMTRHDRPRPRREDRA